ncbi:MAG: glycoside hydrolase family 3 protein [Chloroflexi bacterium]|nr:MAG: glycoside hydrolase family 3 protein [Chloroflexota bacterium]TMC27985.1 MAG: glycoside hydrolase family 3 protein [Chloroflexota bacterium]TMC37099.1 MAG: glycoside hydrolase family 3 protein [Chloroflexota bacterium]TME41472.1 MAG: glycoside hydrolase family 3 protein [Chloroflexota bacterium]
MKRRALLAMAGAAAASCALPMPGEAPPRLSATPVPDRVRAIVAALSVEQKVGQLMSIAFHGSRITPAVEAMIRQRAVGGLVLRAENAEDATALAKLASDLQAIARDAKVPPLFLSIDQEGGPVIRVGKGMTIMPGQMALAATPDPVNAVTTSALIAASELRAAGINWNLAPVADVNDEPRNPIIGNRSFGSDPKQVSMLVAQAIASYRAGRLLACAKHFPGHGATTTDSHTGLPEIDSDRKRLDAVELVPFKAAIAAGAPAIMSAHIVVPALDATPSLPVTLSKKVMTDLLRGELGFTGIVVSDDLEMGALASIGEARAGLGALEAGVDHLLFRFDESAQIEGHRLMVDAVKSGKISAARLDASVARLVGAKVAQGLYDPAPSDSVDRDANARTATDLARQSITLLKSNGVLPLRGKVLVLATGLIDISQVAGDSDIAAEMVALRPNTTGHRFARATDDFISASVNEARGYDAVVVGAADVGVNEDQRKLIDAVAQVKPTVVVSQRAPYDSLYVSGVSAFVCAYSGRVPTLRATIEILTGARKPTGRLPVEIPGRFPLGAGMKDFS